ncbi:MAG: thiamine-phosphate kinase [Bryobacterales bacterium]|nr:thiamine-phosphate kinase [Bryobacterales bacterium]
MKSELALVERIRRRAGRPRRLSLAIGDDCAIYTPAAGEELLFTTDMLIEDAHFRRGTHKAADVGYKTLARGLSDIAAMGGAPRFCLVSLALAEWTDERWVDGFYTGLLELARATGTELAGGDLARADKVMADIVVCGSAPAGTALRRGGAKPGDGIYVSGALGGSALGLESRRGMAWRKHLRPEPRLKAGAALREKWGATACMDLSDGLSTDLHRLCAESRVSAELDGDLPLYPGATVAQALHGGEDYELLFTLPAGVKAPRSIGGTPLTRIGSIRRGNAGRIRIEGFELQPLGYDHFRKP